VFHRRRQGTGPVRGARHAAGVLADSLADLDAGLRGLGGALVVRRGQWIPAVLELARAAERRVVPDQGRRRFDPDGSYVRRHLPELADLSGGSVHEPDAGARRSAGYPVPIVDHRAAVGEYRARRRAAGRGAAAR
jgi:deoxyribodipyrimidine photo-lyase